MKEMTKIFRGRGKLPLPCATTPVVEGYVVTLLPETLGTRVPVQIPDGYLPREQKYPKVRALASISQNPLEIECQCQKVFHDFTITELIQTLVGLAGFNRLWHTSVKYSFPFSMLFRWVWTCCWDRSVVGITKTGSVERDFSTAVTTYGLACTKVSETTTELASVMFSWHCDTGDECWCTSSSDTVRSKRGWYRVSSIRDMASTQWIIQSGVTIWMELDSHTDWYFTCSTAEAKFTL